jgi:hypothetical protein
MDVEMIHRLPAVGLAVDYKPGAFFAASQLYRQFPRRINELPGQSRVAFRYFHDIPDVLFGNYQKVNRRLRRGVMEREDFVILENFFGGNFSPCDFTENAVIHKITVPQFYCLR